MFFVKKSKTDVDMKLVNSIVMAYFDYIIVNKLKLTYSDISELLRYSICLGLGLDSQGYSSKITAESEGVVNFLDAKLKPVKVKGIEYKKGFLEACVHCMEMSRKRVEFN